MPGIDGHEGVPGLPGVKGNRGDPGSAILFGEMGIDGDEGKYKVGVIADHINNFNFYVGPSGESGDRGFPGQPGARGIPGTRGGKGIKGDFGPTGQIGIRGNKGARGDILFVSSDLLIKCGLKTNLIFRVNVVKKVLVESMEEMVSSDLKAIKVTRDLLGLTA